MASRTHVEVEYVDKDKKARGNPQKKMIVLEPYEPFPDDMSFKDAIALLQTKMPEGFTAIRYLVKKREPGLT